MVLYASPTVATCRPATPRFFHSPLLGPIGRVAYLAKRYSPLKSLFSSKRKASPLLRPFFTVAFSPEVLGSP